MDIKIHLYTICWNEAKILPHFLRYYSKFCEKIFIYDNFSTDSSIQICASFPKVEVLNYYTQNQIRDDIYLQIKNNAWKKSRGQCDLVIVCDVDEFLYHPKLNDLLVKFVKSNTSVIRCTGYNMISMNYPSDTEDIFQTIQEGSRSVNFDKAILFNPDLIEEINYQAGAHSCLPIGKIRFNADELLLLHYKYLSLEYMLDRYKEMGKRLSKYNKSLGLGYHYLFSQRRIRKEFKDLWNMKENVINKLQRSSVV